MPKPDHIHTHLSTSQIDTSADLIFLGYHSETHQTLSSPLQLRTIRTHALISTSLLIHAIQEQRDLPICQRLLRTVLCRKLAISNTQSEQTLNIRLMSIALNIGERDIHIRRALPIQLFSPQPRQKRRHLPPT